MSLLILLNCSGDRGAVTNDTKLQKNQDRNEVYGNQFSHILKLAPSEVPYTPEESTMVCQAEPGEGVLSLQY